MRSLYFEASHLIERWAQLITDFKHWCEEVTHEMTQEDEWEKLEQEAKSLLIVFEMKMSLE
jgi:hypothetical protein